MQPVREADFKKTAMLEMQIDENVSNTVGFLKFTITQLSFDV
jgi:hypothetical protein